MNKTLRLKWERKADAVEHIVAEYRAKAGPITCLVFDYGHDFQWFAEPEAAHIEGYLTNLLEAQLAAESAAWKWLTQSLTGLAAFYTPAPPPIPDTQLDELDRLASGAESGHSMQIAGVVYPMLALMLEKCTSATIRTLVAAARETHWVKAVNAALFPYQERAVNAESQLRETLVSGDSEIERRITQERERANRLSALAAVKTWDGRALTQDEESLVIKALRSAANWWGHEPWGVDDETSARTLADNLEGKEPR